MKRLIPVALVILVAVPFALAQEHTPAQHAEHQKMMAAGEKGMSCQMMMEHHKAMAAKMADMDAQLNKLVATMNASTGEKKMDAMAAVINELVSQRSAMHADMEKQQGEMMQHMAMHMASGKDMKDCPMMKASAEAKKK